MADDQIDVKLGVTDAGLKDGMENAANDTKEATSSMSSAFAEMSAAVAESMAKMREAVTEGAAQAKEGLEGFAQKISGVQKTLALLGEVAALGFIGEKVADLSREFAEWGESVEHASKQTGDSADNIQKLDFAAAHSGLSADQMNMAMVRLSRSMVAAQQGGVQAIDAFKTLGLSAEELKGANLDEALGKIANAFQAHADGATKAAIAQQLFGRAGFELIAFLDQGQAGIEAFKQKAEELGVVLSEHDVEAAVELKGHLVDLDAQMHVLKLRAGEELAPAFEQVAAGMAKASAQGGPLQQMFSALGTVMKAVVAVGISFAGVFIEVAEAIAGAASAAYLAAHGEFREAGIAIELSLEKIKKTAQETDAALKALFVTPAASKPAAEGEGGKKPDFNLAGKGSGNASKIADARLALVKAQNAAEMAMTKEHLAEAQKIYDDSYANGLISVREYYDAKLAVTQAGLNADINAKKADQMEAERALATAKANAGDTKGGGEEAVLKARTQLVTITGQLAVLEEKLAVSGVENAAKREDAERKLANTIATSNIAAQEKISTQVLDRAKIVADSRYQMGLITKEQLIGLEQQLADQQYDVARRAIQQRLALEETATYKNPAKVAELNNQLLQLEATYENQKLQLAENAAQEQMADAKSSTAAVEGGFTTAFASIVDGTATVSQAFTKMATDIQRTITDLVAKKMFEQLFNDAVGSSGQSVNSGLMGAFGKLFGAKNNPGLGSGGAASAVSPIANQTVGSQQTSSLSVATSEVVTMTVGTLIAASSGGAGGAGGAGADVLTSLLSGLGGGDFAGSFGFTATGATGSADAVMSGLGAAGDTEGMSALMGLASFDVGTPYVPQDMLAMVHQGEAIVPAHMNSPFAGGGLSVTNNFNLPGQTDLRTQSQIAAMSGSAIQQALQRNG